MPTVRMATADDVLEFTVLVKKFIKEADYPFKVDTTMVVNNYQLALENPSFFIVVAEHDEEVVGFLIGAINTTLFSADKTGIELGWYLQKEHRDAKTGLKLMNMFEKWCKDQGCRHVTMVDIDNLQDLSPLYTRKGYTMTEKTYVKEI